MGTRTDASRKNRDGDTGTSAPRSVQATHASSTRTKVDKRTIQPHQILGRWLMSAALALYGSPLAAETIINLLPPDEFPFVCPMERALPGIEILYRVFPIGIRQELETKEEAPSQSKSTAASTL